MHRTAFRLLWRWESTKQECTPLPKNLRNLIQEMESQEPTSGEERIANELSLNLGVRISPRIVRGQLHTGPHQGVGRSWLSKETAVQELAAKLRQT